MSDCIETEIYVISLRLYRHANNSHECVFSGALDCMSDTFFVHWEVFEKFRKMERSVRIIKMNSYPSSAMYSLTYVHPVKFHKSNENVGSGSPREQNKFFLSYILFVFCYH